MLSTNSVQFDSGQKYETDRTRRHATRRKSKSHGTLNFDSPALQEQEKLMATTKKTKKKNDPNGSSEPPEETASWQDHKHEKADTTKTKSTSRPIGLESITQVSEVR